MIVRIAQSGDEPFIARLLDQLGYPVSDASLVAERIRQHSEMGYKFLVAEADREVIGFIALHWFNLVHMPFSLGRISAFCVDELHRGNGVGILLLEEAERVFRSVGCGKIEVTSNARRSDTHAFYLNRKYVEDSRRFVKYL